GGGGGGSRAAAAVPTGAPRVAITGAPASSPEGTVITLGSTVTDPGSADTQGYAWAVTKDGRAYASGTQPGFSFTPDDNAAYVVTLTVTDDDGGVGVSSAAVAVTNVPPTAAITGAPASSPQGTMITPHSTAPDPGRADTQHSAC